MNINEEEFFDYIKCPAYYDMKYNKNIPATKPKTMQGLLNIVVNYFFTNLLNKKICTMNELKRKWDSICENNKDYINSKRNLEGINYLINFAKWAANNQIVLIDFASEYLVPIEGAVLIGNINPVIALPGRKCEIINARFSNKEPEQSSLDKQLKFTLDCYAFDKAYGQSVDAIKTIHFKNNKEFITNRTNNDYDRLVSTITGVANGIKAKAFYPRESTFCVSCEMKNYCKYWN